MIEFPEISRRGWIRFGFLLFVSCIAHFLSAYAMTQLLDPSGLRRSFGFTFASLAISVLPLLAVLSWKGELSFFDQLKHRGRIRGWRLWLIPAIPSLVPGIASLIDNPKGLTLLYDQLRMQGLDLFAFSSLGLSLLGAVCVGPTVVKWIGDNADWKWFLGLSLTLSFLPSLVEVVYRWSLRDKPATELSMLNQVSVSSIMVTLYVSAISALGYLLLMLWSKGDMRAAIAASLWSALCRFFAPSHAKLWAGIFSAIGLLLLWLAVGGLRQLQRSRAMVAQPETPEV